MGQITSNKRQTSIYLLILYRPPASTCEPLHCLRESIYKIINKEGPSCRVVLAGDFNLPDICWEDGLGCILTSPAYGYEINNLFFDILNDFALEQQVKEPTRSTHILDLVLSSQPQLISDVSVIPSMSDHEAVKFQLNLSVKDYLVISIVKFINIIKQTNLVLRRK